MLDSGLFGFEFLKCGEKFSIFNGESIKSEILRAG